MYVCAMSLTRFFSRVLRVGVSLVRGVAGMTGARTLCWNTDHFDAGEQASNAEPGNIWGAETEKKQLLERTGLQVPVFRLRTHELSIILLAISRVLSRCLDYICPVGRNRAKKTVPPPCTLRPSPDDVPTREAPIATERRVKRRIYHQISLPATCYSGRRSRIGINSSTI